jgi:hypothetical protein
MKKKKRVVVILLFLVLTPVLASADCLDLGHYTGWILEDAHTIVFYRGRTPLARVTTDCEVSYDSRIQLLVSYVCDSSPIWIDGKKCNIYTVQSLY